MGKTNQINIYTKLNGAGLQRDAELLKSLLEPQGWTVKIVDVVEVGRRELAAKQIFLELSDANYFNLAGENYFFPNPEWFKKPWLKHVKRYDKIFCKTKDCFRIFKGLSKRAVFTSFTSPDRYNAAVRKKHRFFHGPGRSRTKGTDELLRLYKQSGDGLPPVTVLQHHVGHARVKKIPNIEYQYQRLSDAEYLKVQNEHAFHLCPSYYEGFGHYINEAKSCGAIVVTPNAPPMNELVTRKFGVLCKAPSRSKRGLVNWVNISPPHLAVGIRYCAGLPDDKIDEMSAAARQSFLDNDKLFKERFFNEML